MRLTIVPADGIVLVDGVARRVDCSSVEANVHAAQWDGASGEIEFNTIDGRRAPNQAITDISSFQHIVDLWNAAAPPPPPPPPPPSVLPQDLMAQFTAADATAIQAAIAGNINFWLLWQAMTAQKDPMIVTNPRFKAGWAALVQVLGQPRMTAIATALNVTIV